MTSLSDTPAVIIATHLRTLGTMSIPSALTTWPLYVSNLPEGNMVERNAGVVFDTSPIKDGRLMTGTVVEHPSITFHIRSTTQDLGWDKINQVALALDAIRKTLITVGSNSYEVRNVTRLGGINSLGQLPGTTREYLYTLNLILSLKEV